MKIWITVLFIISLQAFAVSEKTYQRELEGKVLPLFRTMDSRFFTNAEGLRLHYYALVKPGATKTLVILPGRTEPAKKYAEWVYDLNSSDLNFYILDHQGQGESQRLIHDSTIGHVEKFGNYVSDFTQFMNEIVLPETTHTEHLLLAHSLGSTVGTLYMSQHPKTFKRAVLNSPMMKINTMPLTENLAASVTGRMVLDRRGDSFVPFFGQYKDSIKFRLNPNTQSRARFLMTKALYRAEPSLAVGGPSANWLFECIRQTRTISSAGREIETPILLLQAGRDIVVKKSRQSEFCRRAKNCTKAYFPYAYHEVLFEKDEIRNLVQRRVRDFLGL